MEGLLKSKSTKPVLEKYRRIAVRADHAVVIQTACRPGPWFAAGSAVIAPLYRKRRILLERAKWVYAWTIYNEKLGTVEWHTPPDVNAKLHFPVDIRSRDPSGWILTIPPAIRERAWLPEGPAFVMFEYASSEATLWTEAAYGEESILEADAD